MVVFQLVAVGFFRGALLHFLQLPHDLCPIPQRLDSFRCQAQDAELAILIQVAHLHELTGHVRPLLFVQLLADAIRGQFFMLVFEHFFVLRAQQNVNHVRRPEPFAAALDAGEEFLSRDGDVGQAGGFGGAVVAILAVEGGVRFAEIVQERLAAAVDLVFGITDDGIQMLDRHPPLFPLLIFDKVLDLGYVAITV